MFRNPSVRTTAALVFTLALNLTAAAPAAAITLSPWPASATGTDIGGALVPPDGGSYEPSGIVWDDRTGYLWLVGDSGQVSRMGRDGTGTINWTVSKGLDLESIAVTGTTTMLYLGKESPPTILEYYTSVTSDAPTPTGKSWRLSDLPVSGGSGMEGLTWVPNGYHPYPASSSGGVFYASSQQNGWIYVYDVNLSQSGSLTSIDSFQPDPKNKDISDLYFSAVTRTLFVLYDAANKLLLIDTGTTSYRRTAAYALPTSTDGQEGVTLLPQCPGATTIIYIADDPTTHDVYSFSGFPQSCATR